MATNKRSISLILNLNYSWVNRKRVSSFQLSNNKGWNKKKLKNTKSSRRSMTKLRWFALRYPELTATSKLSWTKRLTRSSWGKVKAACRQAFQGKSPAASRDLSLRAPRSRGQLFRARFKTDGALSNPPGTRFKRWTIETRCCRGFEIWMKIPRWAPTLLRSHPMMPCATSSIMRAR